MHMEHPRTITISLRRVRSNLHFGAHAGEMKVNSTKSMVGHMLGAAGAIEFITCVKEIEEDYIHATVGYKVPDEELDLDYCKEPVSMEVQYALSNSLGFGGHNASILLKKIHHCIGQRYQWLQIRRQRCQY